MAVAAAMAAAVAAAVAAAAESENASANLLFHLLVIAERVWQSNKIVKEEGKTNCKRIRRF